MRILRNILRNIYRILPNCMRPLALLIGTKIRISAKPGDIRPGYANGVYKAAIEARALSLNKIAVIEFGVAGGIGLLALEAISKEVTRETGVNISVYGFDRVVGLPQPQDYRDLPCRWKPSFFRMEEDKLRARLQSSELVLGDVQQTVPIFLNRKDVPPIGFISIDLDFYTSTKAALQILRHEDMLAHYLPRISMYFDDIFNYHMSEYVGELLAIAEFNQECIDRKISQNLELKYHHKYINQKWAKKMYVCHFFKHPLYCQYVEGVSDKQILIA